MVVVGRTRYRGAIRLRLEGQLAMPHIRGTVRRSRRQMLNILLLAALLLVGGAASAFAGAAPAGANVTWRNEGLSSAKGWTTGEIGPYDEGSLVPFRLTITNPSKTRSAVVGSFSLQVTREAHGVTVFDSTTDWTGPLAPLSQDGIAEDMLRTTFPAGLQLAPGESATLTFSGHLAVSTPGHPAAGTLKGNGVCGFSEVAADDGGSFGKRVPVKLNAASVLSSARVLGSVFGDLDSNGVWGYGELGVGGCVLQLSDAQGNLVASALSDDTGAYAFDGVKPGVAYTISIVQDPAWVQTAPVGGVFTITPSPGQNAGPFDFGVAFGL
jgi:hypothetical protein